MKFLSYYRVVASVLLLLPETIWAQTPTVTSTLPTRAATSAPRTGPVTINFSQSIDAAAANMISVVGGGVRRTGSIQGSGTSQISFQPTTPFLPGEQVSVTVPATVSNPAQVYSFTAAAGVGPGVFGLPVSTSSHIPQPIVVTTGDVDNDGDTDVIIGGTVNDRLSYLLPLINNGQGKFSEYGWTYVSQSLSQIFLADFTNDGKLDIIAVGKSENEISLVIGSGIGTFYSQIKRLTCGNSPNVVIGDFNADGLQDIVISSTVGNNASATLQAYLGNKSGELIPSDPYQIDQSVSGLSAADINEDGTVDLILASGVSFVSVYSNDGLAKFSKKKHRLYRFSKKNNDRRF